MLSLTPEQRRLLQAGSQLAYCNPFLPERIALERSVLGAEFLEGETVWSQQVADPDRPRPNVVRLAQRLEQTAEAVRTQLDSGASATAQELTLYEDTVLHMLYLRWWTRFYEADCEPAASKPPATRWRFYNHFLADWRRFLEIDGVTLPGGHEPVHTFACFRQIWRAFDRTLRDIIGASMPAARLRASIWQSIFTHDMRRYRRTLFSRMGEFATLVTGPSGSGKELVARAIGMSRYAAFDDRRLTFADDGAGSFFPINISALSPTLVESELFGHRRGSFTGAIADRKGWLETCPALGSVFLDELGDLDPAIQVKLLRVIETRTFHPVGDTASMEFRGKLITATNRDLAAFMRQGKFREDLYYRLCSDQIATPSLADQLADSPAVLPDLTLHIARRVAGPEAPDVAAEVADWIEKHLGPSYAWPGNYRELEQCVKNFLIRRDYRPTHAAPDDPADALAADTRAGRLTADDLLSRYVTLVYGRTGSYEETARRLGLDRRTVKAKIDQEMLARMEK